MPTLSLVTNVKVRWDSVAVWRYRAPLRNRRGPRLKIRRSSLLSSQRQVATQPTSIPNTPYLYIRTDHILDRRCCPWETREIHLGIVKLQRNAHVLRDV